MYDVSVADRAKSIAHLLPSPCVHRVLAVLAPVAEKTSGGIIRPELHKQAEDAASVLACVVKVGPDCFRNPDDFPSGTESPPCKVGDWISFRSYSGTRIKIRDLEFRVLNDDMIETVVPKPEEFMRA